ncbi:MAG: hypothetical protein P1S60_08900 [Anaerolineae bacterium]|nr:hypothetical protein [Anaerolineae bacterium]
MNWPCLAMVIFLAGLLFACTNTGIASEPPTPTRESLSQWVAAATASSQYGIAGWSAQRVTGVPDVTGCVDDSRAWASGRGNGAEWLLLEYRIPVFATEVNIYQTYGRGAISRVTIYDEDNEGEVIWEGQDSADPCPGVLSVPVPMKPYRVSRIRIDLDESRTGYWNQVDSVELVGFR